MTTEEKQVLLQGLCTRLPYNTQGEGIYEEEVWHNGFPRNKKVVGHIEGIDHIGFDDGEIYITIEGIQCELRDVKLYLRPMSSMTEEEKAEYDQLCYNCQEQDSADYNITELDRTQLVYVIDWLNAHYFDYRGWIEKRLALEALKGMYNI